MLSHYSTHESHYANLDLPIHDRINDLDLRAAKLAPRVAESAAESGCTDRRPSDDHPRAQSAWDMCAEALGWNAISDQPGMLSAAEQCERDGRTYYVGYGGSHTPWPADAAATITTGAGWDFGVYVPKTVRSFATNPAPSYVASLKAQYGVPVVTVWDGVKAEYGVTDQPAELTECEECGAPCDGTLTAHSELFGEDMPVCVTCHGMLTLIPADEVTTMELRGTGDEFAECAPMFAAVQPGMDWLNAQGMGMVTYTVYDWTGDDSAIVVITLDLEFAKLAAGWRSEPYGAPILRQHAMSGTWIHDMRGGW